MGGFTFLAQQSTVCKTDCVLRRLWFEYDGVGLEISPKIPSRIPDWEGRRDGQTMAI